MKPRSPTRLHHQVDPSSPTGSAPSPTLSPSPLPSTQYASRSTNLIVYTVITVLTKPTKKQTQKKQTSIVHRPSPPLRHPSAPPRSRLRAHDALKPGTPTKLGIVGVSHLHVYSICPPLSSNLHSPPSMPWRRRGGTSAAAVPSRVWRCCCHARCGGSVVRGGEGWEGVGETGGPGLAQLGAATGAG